MPSDRKTEPPTARRLRRARREGDHPVSRSLCGFGGLCCFAVFAALALEALLRDAAALLWAALRADSELNVSELALRVAWLVSPIVGVMALGALVVGLWQTGGALSLSPLAWDWQRLRPWAAAARTSAGARLFSALAMLALTGLLGALAWHVLRAAGPGLAVSVGDGPAAVRAAAKLSRDLLLWGLGATAAVAIADALVVRRTWYGRLRMSREEVRREQRENEGDDGLKQARQRARQELASNAEATQLQDCTLLVLGPPRLAVALRYDSASDNAPRILIQGSGALARTLEALAPSYGVPVYHDAALARNLASLPADAAIPKAYYAELATALRSVLDPTVRGG